MEQIWLISGIVLTALGCISVFFGAKLMQGVPGELREVKSQALLALSRIEHVDDRITREVKTRASLAAKEAREEEKSIEVQAAEMLATPAVNVTSLRRPSVVTGK